MEVFKNYNQAVFPIQMVFNCLGFIIIYFAIKPNPKVDRIIVLLLAFFWFWIGIVYHIIFFSVINKLAYLFGGLFIIQGILFLIFGVFKNKLSFQFKEDIYGITGMILILFAMIIYPIFTIIVLVLGQLLWVITGVILAVPLTAMLNYLRLY